MTQAPFFPMVIPAYNEEGSIGETCEAIMNAFCGEGIDDYEIVVVNDHSRDGKEERGYRVEKVPISWTNRKAGVSKLRIKEMGGRYLFIVLYCWLEKKLARGDYYRPGDESEKND